MHALLSVSILKVSYNEFDASNAFEKKLRSVGCLNAGYKENPGPL